MGLQERLAQKKAGQTAPQNKPTPSAPSSGSSALSKRLAERKAIVPSAPKPAPKPLKVVPYTFGASDKLLGITQEFDQNAPSQAEKSGESSFKWLWKQPVGLFDKVTSKIADTKYFQDVGRGLAERDVAIATGDPSYKPKTKDFVAESLLETLDAMGRAVGQGSAETVKLGGNVINFATRATYGKDNPIGNYINGFATEMADTLTSDRMRAVQNQEFGKDKLLNADFWLLQGTAMLPTTIGFMKLGGGVYKGTNAVASKVFGASKTAQIASNVLSTGTSAMSMRGFESAAIAEDTYNTAIKKGMSEEDAIKASKKVFWDTSKLVGMDAAQALMAFSPLGKYLGKKGVLGKIMAEGGGLLLGGASEGYEEMYQYVAEKKALGEEYSWTDPEALESGVLGFAMGAAFQGSGRLAEADADKAKESYYTDILRNLPAYMQTQLSADASGSEKEAYIESLAGENPDAVADAIRSMDGQHDNRVKATKDIIDSVASVPTGEKVKELVESGMSREEVALQLGSTGMSTQEALAVVDGVINGDVKAEFAKIDETLLERTAAQLKKENDAKSSKSDTDLADIKKSIADLQKRIQDPKNATQKETLRTELESKRLDLQKAQGASQEDAVRSAKGIRALVNREVDALGVTENKAQVVEQVIEQITSGQGSVTVREIIRTTAGAGTKVVDTQKNDKNKAKIATENKEKLRDKKTEIRDVTKDKEGLKNINPALYRKAEKAKTVDEFIGAVVKAEKTTRDKVSIENLTEFFERVHADEKPSSQKEAVKEVVAKKGKATIKEIAEETGILEPNVRRILGVGAKEGEFERIDSGVYKITNKNGEEVAVIIPADAVETLPKLAKEGFKADMVFLDIPYDTPAVKGGNRGVKYGLISVEDFDKVLTAVKTILRTPNSPIIHMFSQAESGLAKMQKYNDLFTTKGFVPVGRGEYQKTFADGSPVTSPNGKVAKPEGILVFTQSGKTDKSLESLQFKMVRPKGYQTEKPAEMLKAMIGMTTNEGDVVLDPFAGSGVTIDEAVKAGRKAVGIEKKDGQAEKIKERVEASVPTTSALIKIPEVLYHGTLADFESFDPARKGENTAVGNSNWGFFFIEDIERARTFTEDTRGAGDGRLVTIKKVSLDIKKPFDLTQSGVFDNEDQAGLLYEIMTNEKASSNKEAAEWIEENVGLGEFAEFYDALYSDLDYKKLIEDAGYDGIVSSFGNDEAGETILEYVAFYPKQITILDNNVKEADNKDNENDNDTRGGDNSGGTPSAVSDSPKQSGGSDGTAPVVDGKDGGGDNADGGGDAGKRPRTRPSKQLDNTSIEAILGDITRIMPGGEVVLTGEVTEKELEAANAYKSGGVTKEGRGILDEYYTNSKIVESIKGLFSFPPVALKVLEPAIGTGNFVYALPDIGNHNVVGFEINKVTAQIAKIFHPNAKIYNRSFETEFIDDRGKAKEYAKDYDLVIGNPPYGEHRGEFIGLGEEKKLVKYEDYFVKRGLDSLKEGGALAMVLPSGWLNRKGTMLNVQIEIAFRLPNGVFEGTDIGTDIVVLRKKTGVMSIPGSAYFNENPQNVLGEVKQRRGRFGDETYVDGTLDDALASISQAMQETKAIEILKDLHIPVTEEAITEVAEVVEQAGKGAKKIVKVEKRQETEAQKQGKKTIEKKVKKTSTTGGAVMSLNTVELDDATMGLWRRTTQAGFIERTPGLTEAEIAQHGAIINKMAGAWYLDFNYAQGDIYERLSQLEIDYREKNVDKERYEVQKAKLEAVLPTRETVLDMKLTPNTDFIKQYPMKVVKAGETIESNMQTEFKTWTQSLPRAAFGNSNTWEVSSYVNNEQVRGTDAKMNERVRSRRKLVANALFAKYLQHELDADEQRMFEDKYNATFNFYHTPDYTQVPMFSEVNEFFGKGKFRPNTAQRKGVGRLTNTGVGILAHEVGFGKTISGVLTAHEAMARGWAKRPLIVVPNDNVASQWIDKTILALVPNAKVNFLGNLGASFKGDLSTLEIEEGSFTVITYEGLKRLSFTDETYAEMAEKFAYVGDELKKNKTKRDEEKGKASIAENRGKMKKGTRADLTFEGLGFDHFTFDEAHNANHVVGKVKLEKGQASEFNRFGLMPSDLGIKTWLAAQYIQARNNGRNVTLLSATPFTNHPLEYYSILSMVADKSMQKMGFRNVNEFFGTFMEASDEFEFKADGSYEKKVDIRGFKNYRQFRKLMDSFIDFEQDSPDIERPNRIQKSYEIPKNAIVREVEAQAQAIFQENEKETGKGAKILRAISELQLIAISPYLSQFATDRPSHKEFIENSPKLDVVMRIIAQNKKDKPEAGQIIYSQKGVEIFPYLKEYLVKEVGFKESEVAIIVGGKGSVSPAKRVQIQEDYNAGKIKVLIGSDTITEGMNLQINTTDMHLLSLPWNFTALRQVIGRAWRQQNQWRNVRINQYFMQDSVDVFMSQKLDNKQRRYENAIKSNANEIDSGDVSFEEFKFDLIKDPTTRAKLELQAEKEQLDLAIAQEKAELAFATRRLEKVSDLQSELVGYQNSLQNELAKPDNGADAFWVTRYQDYIVKAEKTLNETTQALKERGVSVDSLLETKRLGEIKITELEAAKKALDDTFADRVSTLALAVPASVDYSKEVADGFVGERAKENRTFYEKAVAKKAETITVEKAPKVREEVATEKDKKVAKKTVVKKKTTKTVSKGRDARVMAVLGNTELSVPEKVSEILNSKQEGKAFKDIGERVGGSKKERAAIMTVMENGDAGVIAEMIRTLGGEVVAETLQKADILEDAIVPNYEADKNAKIPAIIADWKMRVFNNIAKTPAVQIKRVGRYRHTININTDDIPKFLSDYPDLLRSFAEELANVTDFKSAYEFNTKYRSYFIDYRNEADIETRNSAVHIGILGRTISKIIGESNLLQSRVEDMLETEVVLKKGVYQDQERLNSDRSWDSSRTWAGFSYSGRATFYETKEEADESFEKYKATAESNTVRDREKFFTGYDQYQKKKAAALDGVDLSHGNFEEIKKYDRAGTVEAKRLNVETLTTELGFKSVQLGNYMDDATSKQHIEQTIAAIEDMSFILDVDFPKMFNDKGLSVAFGARGGGRFNAHYEPTANIINLTKNRGDGSFGHELIHFFDWKQHPKSYRGKWSGTKTRTYVGDYLDQATMALMDALTGRKIIKEVTLQPSDDSYVLNRPENEIMQMYAKGVPLADAIQQAKGLRWAESQTLQWVADVYRKPVTETMALYNQGSDFYKGSKEVGGGSVDSYWVKPHELLARAGQAYLEDKMIEAGIKNSYVTRSTFGQKHYPQGEERKIFNALFDEVFKQVRKQYPLDENKARFVARFKEQTGSQTLVHGSYAIPFLRSVKERLQIDFDVRFVDSILASETAQKNKPPQEAFGAVIGNTVLLAKEITRWTGQHEVGHLVFNNLERLRAFKDIGVTKEALVKAKIAQLRSKGITEIGKTSIVGRIGVKEVLAVEEQIMLDFEEYLENKYQPEAGIMKRFFLTLKRLVMDFARLFQQYPDVLTDFYEMIDTGMAIDGGGAHLETDGILDEYMRDRRYGAFDYAEAEALYGGARFKLRDEPDQRLQKLEKTYNETETVLTQKQEELEKSAVAMDAEIERKGRLAELVDETPKEVKDLRKNATRKPPVVLSDAGVSKAEEYGFENQQEAEEQIQAYVRNKTELLETRNQLATLRRQIATLKRGSKEDKAVLRDIERKLKARKAFLEKKEYYVTLGQGQGKKEQMKIIRKRGQTLNDLQDMIGLSDARAKSLIGELTKQKMHLMSERAFDDFIIQFINRGTDLANKLYEQQEVSALIQEKQLKKVDNLRKAMKLPTITKMNAEQASLFAKALSEYESGDVFLTKRQLETIHRTVWDGAQTEREMFGKVFEETGITAEDLKNVEVSGDLQKFKNWLVLSRSNPLFAWIIDKRFKAELETHSNVVAFEEQLNPIVNKARKSRTRPFVGRLAQVIAPMDELVFGYIEAEDKEEYRTTNEMTTEEVDLALFLMTRLYLPAKDYMQTEYAMATRENYITHIRRGIGETFINAISEGKSVPKAVREAISEVFSSQKEDELQFGILAGKTGDVVAFEKWFKFAMPRSGNMAPTKNVAKASLAYARAYYKKRAVDAFVPEVLAVAKMQEQIVGTTPKGLPKNPKVQEFINEMLNDAKGRKIQFITEQGSTTDNALRFGIMFTAFKYLGFRPVMGLVSFIGEFVATMRATTTVEKWRGLSRTIQVGKAHGINQKYKYFTGRNPLGEVFAPEHELTTRIKQTALVLYSFASFFNSRFYLRAVMTEAEWQSELMTDSRMVEITKEMSKWRKTPFYVTSLAGGTAIGSMFNQFGTWAIPIVTTTLSDTQHTYENMKKDGFKSAMTSEEAKSLGKTVAVMGTMYFISMGIKAMDDDDDDRDIWFYMAREMNTLMGAFGVMFDLESRATPALMRQLIDLLTLFKQTLSQEAYEKDGIGYGIGDLKMWNTLEKVVLPSFVVSTQKLFSGEQVKENTKARLIGEAIESGGFDPKKIAEEVNPDDWNDVKNERTPEKQLEYQEGRVHALTMEYNLRKKYPESEITDIILTVDNNTERVARMIKYGQEVGEEKVYGELKDIYRDKSLCGNDKKNTVCPVSEELFKAYREAR